MLRVGPSRNTQAGGIAAILSCVGVILCFLGFFFTIPGIALIASSQDSTFDDEFFEESNRGQLIGGIVCLTIGLIMLVTGIICCIIMCKKANEAIRSQGGQTQGTVIAGPVVTGTVPMGQQYNTGYSSTAATYPQGGYTGAPYGQPQTAPYPPMGSQYPPPASQYPPPASQYPPPPTNPAYSPDGSNSYPPPPSYGDAVDKS